MRNPVIFLSSVLIFTSMLFAQEQRKVLVEVFTNSHCPLCPPAHNTINNYLAGPNGDKISYIFYHMVFPYSDDLLYQQSMEGSEARYQYYNPVASTPRGFFDGVIQGSTSGWATTLNNLVSAQSPLIINLSGTRNPNQFNINAYLTRTGDIPDNDLVIHFVLAEDLYYSGRNGISNHKHVMRKMFPTPAGQPFTIDLNETKEIPQTIDLDPLWDADSLNVIVFVQSTGSMTVYQSETINYNDLTATGVENENSLPEGFSLQQNYPNPFNPSTSIKFSIPESGLTTLKVYNILGNEVTTLISGELKAGTFTETFDASDLPSGVYFYTLKSNNFYETKKMMLLK
jgi:hypothetical protein